ITICLLVLVSGCVEDEPPYRHYDRYEEAVTAGELQRGWLPRWVPDAASDIHLQGDIDTSEVWFRFRLPAQGNRPLQDTLVELSLEEIRELLWRQPRGAKAWWPRNLIQQQPADDIA